MTIKKYRIKQIDEYKIVGEYHLLSPDKARKIAIEMINESFPSSYYSYLLDFGNIAKWEFISSSGGFFWKEVLPKKIINYIKEKGLMRDMQFTEEYTLIICDY